jgi:OHS family lactose permease-like MFS transporter
LLEAIGMAVIPFFVNKVGAKKALIAGGMIMICRILVSATSESPYIISLIKLFHAIEVPLFVISVFKYSVSNFDSRLSSTIFLVGFQIASSLGIVCYRSRWGCCLMRLATILYSICSPPSSR